MYVHSVYSVLYNVYTELYSVYCTLYTVKYCTFDYLLCIKCTVQYTQYSKLYSYSGTEVYNLNEMKLEK